MRLSEDMLRALHNGDGPIREKIKDKLVEKIQNDVPNLPCRPENASPLFCRQMAVFIVGNMEYLRAAMNDAVDEYTLDRLAEEIPLEQEASGC